MTRCVNPKVKQPLKLPVLDSRILMIRLEMRRLSQSADVVMYLGRSVS
jgi:hypothetical protein